MFAALMPILAQANSTADVLNLPGTPQTTSLSSMRATEILIVIAAMLLLLTILIIWAVFIRKPKNENGRTRVHKPRPSVEETEDGELRVRKRMKRQRRPHRQRNPTLSEAGGLPPVRPDGAPPPL